MPFRSSTDRAHIQHAQRVLLSPLRYGDADAWLRAAAEAVQRLLGGDRSYAFRIGPDAMQLIPHTVDPAFKTTSERYLNEMIGSRSPTDAPPLPLRMHAQRMQRGSGVYHEQHLVTREDVEQSPFFQDVAVPFGVQYATGLSAVQGEAETVLCVAFEKRDAPGFAVETSEQLDLLTPAFEAGVRHLRCLHRRRIHLRRVLDRLTDALFVFSIDGRELYRNRALRRLLQRLRDPAPLSRAAAQVALSIAEDRLLTDAPRARRTVPTPAGRYTLRGTWAGDLLDNQPGVVVTAEPHAPYPPPLILQTEYDLTPREAEVALHVARGMTDAQIADALNISVYTVRRHVSAVRAKVDVDTRTAVADRLARWNRPPPAHPS